MVRFFERCTGEGRCGAQCWMKRQRKRCKRENKCSKRRQMEKRRWDEKRVEGTDADQCMSSCGFCSSALLLPACSRDTAGAALSLRATAAACGDPDRMMSTENVPLAQLLVLGCATM